MSCDCIKTVRTTQIVDLGTVLVLVIPFTSFRVRENFKLVICQDFPAGNPAIDPQVVISDGTNVFLTFNKLSEFVRRSNIVCNRCYHAIASNDPLHIQLRGLVDTCKCSNEILVPTTTTPVTLDLATIITAIETNITSNLEIGGGADA